jgi:hypothetical protein
MVGVGLAAVKAGCAKFDLLAWRGRMATRPAVRPVIDRMADYLRSIDYPVPPYDCAIVVGQC